MFKSYKEIMIEEKFKARFLTEARKANNTGTGKVDLPQFSAMFLAGDTLPLYKKKKFFIEMLALPPNTEIETAEQILDHALRALLPKIVLPDVDDLPF